MASNRSSDSAPATVSSAVPPGWRRRHLLATGLGLALLGAGCALPAFAEGRLVQVDVIDRDTDRPLHVYRDHGRPVVAGRPGARYAVQVANRTGERVMVVVAIDGVNIMTGETAAVDQDGYVLEPYQSASLTGWRKTHTEVAAFEFTSLANSYAARTGRPDDVGVIGVAVFRERPGLISAWHASHDRTDAPPSPRPDLADSRAAPIVPAAQPPLPATDAARMPASKARGNAAGDVAAATAAAPRAVGEPQARTGANVDGLVTRVPAEPIEHLGTGHGDRETSVVVDTTFDRLTARPQEVVRIRYDSLPNLVAAGLAPRTFAQAPTPSPRAFPGDAEPGFVPDPPTR